jgi:Replication-relaxation
MVLYERHLFLLVSCTVALTFYLVLATLSFMETVPYQLGLLPMARAPLTVLRKPVKTPPFVITPVYDVLLRDLNTLQRATAEQLCRLNYKMGMLTTVKARLKDLTEAGYILPLFHPLIKLPYVYCLNRKGLQYLEELGIDVRDYFRPSEEKETERNFLFREHMLAISDVLIHALLFEKSEPAYRLEKLLHERFYKNHPIKTTYTKNNKEESKTLVPDSYLEFIHTREGGKEVKIPVILELDRGTEEQKFFRRRLRAYIVFLKSRAFETIFHVKSMTIAFATTKDHNRLTKMREWARLEFGLTQEPKWLADLFLFTALPEHIEEIEPRQLFLDPVWYLPGDDTHPVSLLGE